MGKLPITYFQTLVETLGALDEASVPPTRNGDDGETDAVSVDVDALIRKGQKTGFGAQ